MSVLRSFRDKVLGSFGSDSHLSGAVVVADSDDTEYAMGYGGWGVGGSFVDRGRDCVRSRHMRPTVSAVTLAFQAL